MVQHILNLRVSSVLKIDNYLNEYYAFIWSAAVRYLIYLARESGYYASPNIGSPLPNKSNIGQAADRTTVLLFLPRVLILLVIRGNHFKS